MRSLRKKYGNTIVTSTGINIELQRQEPDEIIDITNPNKPITIKGKSIDSRTNSTYTKTIRRK